MSAEPAALAALQAKADVLVEALPYIQRFQGETFVVKYGGHAMEDEGARQSFARDVVLMRSIGVNVIIVHGGGPMIQSALARFGVKSEFRAGMRVTDDATMEVVRMVLVGQVNQDIVALINQAGGRAVGLSGADGNLLRARKMLVGGEDVGRVGQPTRVDDGELRLLTRGGFIPVIAPVGVDAHGKPLNVNADLAAGAIAMHTIARRFILMTDVEGVRGADGQVINSLPAAAARAMMADGTIHGGMIPKLDCALEALDSGVEKVHILDGRQRHALLLEMFTDSGVGTEIVQ
ncbi:MAG: acetylglutamate kinase [Myxococcales bacterium]|nr:acetylglutamate kinase [Myxococcales bacterium]MCB9547690.1 acetylglutamate kinase [Myxococcales bacterium]